MGELKTTCLLVIKVYWFRWNKTFTCPFQNFGAQRYCISADPSAQRVPLLAIDSCLTRMFGKLGKTTCGPATSQHFDSGEC